MPNNTNYGPRETDSFEGRDTHVSMESMMASMQALTEALSSQREEASMAGERQATFAAEEDLKSFFKMTVEEEKAREEGLVTAPVPYFPHSPCMTRARLRSLTMPPDDELDEMGHKEADEQLILEAQRLAAAVKVMKEELANLEAARLRTTPGISDDDINLDLYSDSVEESELKEG